MTLLQLIEALEAKALAIPDIRSCVRNDITRINEMRSVEYGVFGITQNEHTYTQSTSKMTYSLNLFYIDRLVNDGENEIEVQSHGIEVLRAILMRANEEGMPVNDGVRYTGFTRRFQDLCAGAWAEVSIQIPVSDCNDIFNEK